MLEPIAARNGRAILPAASRRCIDLERRFSRAGVDPLDDVEWTRRDAVIRDTAGAEVFRQQAVEVPARWSETATRVVASKYFRGSHRAAGAGASPREHSVRQLLGRVVGTIAGWVRTDGTFSADEAVATFAGELSALLVEQRAS